MRSMTNWDISDLELLMAVDESADEEGWTKTEDIRQRFLPNEELGSRCVGTRFSWLRRYGVLEKRDGRNEWRLTNQGRVLKSGALSDTDTRVLDSMASEDLVLLTRYTTRRYRKAGQSAGHMIRREWMRGTTAQPRKRSS